jgi:hypothetical protein
MATLAVPRPLYARRHTAADDISGVATDAARALIGSAPGNERVGIFTTGPFEKPRLGERQP